MKKSFLCIVAVVLSLFYLGLPVFYASGNEEPAELEDVKPKCEETEISQRVIARECKKGKIVAGSERRTAYFSVGVIGLTGVPVSLFQNCFYYKGKIYIHLEQKLTDTQIRNCFILINTPITPERNCYLYCETSPLDPLAKTWVDIYCKGTVMVISIDYAEGKNSERSILGDLDRRMYVYPINLLGCEITRHR